MTDRRSCRLAVMALLAVPAAATAQDGVLPNAEHYRLRVEYREYRPSLTGTFQKGNGVTAGDEIDFDEDLGFTDQRAWEVHGAIQFRPGHKLRGSYTQLDYDATVPEARRNFTVGDTRFARFSEIFTSAKGAFYTAEYEWDFLKGQHGFLGVLVGGKAIDLDWVISAPSTSQRESDTLRAPVPTVGGAARFYVGRLSLDGELSSSVGIGSGSAFEAQTSARLHISDRLALQGGYRLIKLTGEQGLDTGDMRLSGFTFGVELSL
jgi:hypothetical protein